MTAIVQNLRTPIVLPVAAAITVGLFLMMRQMIDVPFVAPEVVAEAPPVEIRFDVVEIEADRSRRPEFVPVAVPPPAPVPDTPRSAAPENFDGVDNYRLPPVDTAEISTRGGLVSPDSSPVPIVRIQPVFPAREAARGNSGSCTVMFDITPQGTTTNIRPVACDSRAFEQATLNAVSRWRYNPQVQDGEPILFRGATTRLDYQLNG
ncbi:energy transducer TonB [Maricaulis sp.]|jgi:periplasmic protein TonB|uniref:energy transducer TonB n=1 Tax=Maricaulis sp. TaxID=1486257 RepID=UPI00261AB6CC|nr:energy transducer TonB [Maricaulis sp.]MDF1769390.1 energy transducer TonB [Maricaulis sp.]